MSKAQSARGRVRRGKPAAGDRIQQTAERPAGPCQFTPPQLAQVIETAAANGVTRTVIDTPPHTSDAALAAGRAADLIIVPCQPATADLHSIKTTIDIARLARRPVVVVINRALVKHPANDEARLAIRQYGIHSCPVILHHRIDHQHAYREGLAATELAPENEATGEVRALERWIRSVQT